MIESIKNSKIKKQPFFYILIAIVAVLAFKVVAPYFSVIVMAFVTVFIFRPVYDLFLKLFRRESVATTLSVLVVILTFMIPIIILTTMTIQQTRLFLNSASEFVDSTTGKYESELEEINTLLSKYEEEEFSLVQEKIISENILNVEQQEDINKVNDILATIPPAEYQFIEGTFASKNINNPFQGQIDKINEVLKKVPNNKYQITDTEIVKFIQNNINPAVDFVFSKAVDLGVLLSDMIPKIVVYIFLISGLFPTIDNIQKYIKKISPLSDEIDEIYMKKVVEMSKSMVKGSFVIAVVQGIISGIVLQIVGIDYVFFLTLIMIFLSIIPLGAGVINMPIGFWLIVFGNNVVGGLLVLLNHFLIITNVDNVLRPRLVSKDAHLDPILVLISVLGGIKAFGFMGFIYGPVIMIFMVTTLEIYAKYYKDQQEDLKA